MLRAQNKTLSRASTTIKMITLLFIIASLLLNPIVYANPVESSKVLVHHSDEISSSANGLFDIVVTLSWDKNAQNQDGERTVSFKVEVKNISLTVRHLSLEVGRVIASIANARIEKTISSPLIELDLDSQINVQNTPTLFNINFPIPNSPTTSPLEVTYSLSYVIEIVGDFHYIDAHHDYYEDFNVRGVTDYTSIALTAPASHFPWETFAIIGTVLALFLVCMTPYFAGLRTRHTKHPA